MKSNQTRRYDAASVRSSEIAGMQERLFLRCQKDHPQGKAWSAVWAPISMWECSESIRDTLSIIFCGEDGCWMMFVSWLKIVLLEA